MSRDANNRFGDYLRRFRIAAGLTQAELAERAGLSERGISDLERGAIQSPRRDTIQLLVEALNLSEEDRATLMASRRRHVRTPPLSSQCSLPTPLTPLLGRERKVETARELLIRSDIRLLTLVGLGGVGKTRLALELANDLAGSFQDGVCFVDLANIRDPQLLVPIIAREVGVRESGSQEVLNHLQAFLSDKQMLLVLDNFEQILAAAPSAASLLTACPRLKALVTSRELLHLSGEHVFRVPPLALPPTEAWVTSEQVVESPAVRLFAVRAEAARSDFSLSPEIVPTVAAICTKLEGVPLSIELAAARIPHLPPQAMLDLLDRRLPLLTGGSSDQPARLREMSTTVAWSYDLLAPDEQRLFRRLSVFAGGFTLEAAVAVAGSRSQEADSTVAILDQIASLVDKSLVNQVVIDTGEPRYEMIATIGEFGMNQLAANGEEPAFRSAHAEYFLRLAEGAAPELTGPQQITWLNRLEVELNNLRAALSWLLEQQAAEKALRLAVALGRFWDHHSHLSEGRRWLEAALAREGSKTLAGELRARALQIDGVLARAQGDNDHAYKLLNESLSLFREIGDDDGAGFALNSMGTYSLYQEEYATANALHEEALQLFRNVGNDDGIAAVLANLGYGALLQGQYSEAVWYCDQSLSIYRDLGSTIGSANTLGILGRAVLEQGDHRRAAALLAESLNLNREESDKWYVAECLEGLAAIAAVVGQWERSARLFSAAKVLCAAIGVELPKFDRAINARYLKKVRQQLSHEAFEVAWEDGRSMPLEEVVAEALDFQP